jgi:hypothetical protein
MRKLKTLLVVGIAAITMIIAASPAQASPGGAGAKKTTILAAADAPFNFTGYAMPAAMQISANVFVNSEMEDFYKTPNWSAVAERLAHLEVFVKALNKNQLITYTPNKNCNIDITAFEKISIEDLPPLTEETLERWRKIDELAIRHAFGIPIEFDHIPVHPMLG